MQIKHQLCITANTGEHITKDTYSIKKDVVIDVGENAMNANNDARKKLMDELENKFYKKVHGMIIDEMTIGKVADFILERERKIVEPLVNLPKRSIDYGDSMHRLAVFQSEAIKETLKRAELNS